MAAHYDDPAYSYTDYWYGREYEHESEVSAILRLLKNHSFSHVVDIGGGFGRLSPYISRFSEYTTLLEPSNKLRSQASGYLSLYPDIKILSGTAQKTRLPDSSQDLAVLVRVVHHLPDPLPAFREIHRILKPQGLFLLEFANSHNFKAVVNSWISGQPILPVPIDRRSLINIKRKTIPFVNHSPKFIQKLLHKSDFKIISVLSVSNFRSPVLKKFIPKIVLVKMENVVQPLLAPAFFGPSIFVLAQKTSKSLGG